MKIESRERAGQMLDYLFHSTNPVGFYTVKVAFCNYSAEVLHFGEIVSPAVEAVASEKVYIK